MTAYTIIPGPNSTGLAHGLGRELNAAVLEVYRKVFPDGEQYVRIGIENIVKNSRYLLVASMYPNQDRSFVEVLLLANALKNNDVDDIIGIITYIAYSRQDKMFLPGEPISIEAILKSLYSVGVKDLITIDMHSPRSLEFFPGKSINILISDLLVSHALKYLETPIVLAPDKGALGRARFAAEKHGLEFDYLVKHRDRITGEITMEPKELSVRGRDVVIVDDIISTGGTIALATGMCLRNGARRVIVAASHSLLVGGAVDKIRSAGALKIVTANTIPVGSSDFIEVVDISGRIAEVLREAF